MLDAVIRARCDADLKKTAEDIFKQLGITTSQAINMFLAKVTQEKGIPFELKIPNELTQSVMQDVRNNTNLEKTSIEELKAEFKRNKSC